MKIKELYEQINSGRIISDIDLQREIVYDSERQRLVIDSLVRGIPLPAFYFWQNEDGTLETLDGKQRIEAVKKFYHNELEYEGNIYKTTAPEIQRQIDEAEICEIICSGNEILKREIFRRINTLGIPLSEYEVLNGLYHGEYLRGLTRYCSDDKRAKKILGAPARGRARLQLLRLLGKICNFSGKDGLNDYVKKNANESFDGDMKKIRKYINFVADVFEEYGQLAIFFDLALKYHGDVAIWKENKKEINRMIKAFLKSDAAKLLPNKAKEIEDIIQAIVNEISVDPKRLFTQDDKNELLEKTECEGGKFQCAKCGQFFLPNELEMDHILPWCKGGRTVLSNAQLLCQPCNRKKGEKREHTDSN